MSEDSINGGIRLQVHAQGSACRHVRDYQEANFSPVMTRDNDVLRYGRQSRDCPQAQEANVIGLPLVSLKSSATRPSNRRPRSGTPSSTNRKLSPIR